MGHLYLVGGPSHLAGVTHKHWLLIATHVSDNLKDYVDVIRRSPEPMDIILDNGAWEGDVLPTVGDLVTLANSIVEQSKDHRSVSRVERITVVLPDEIGDGQDSLEKSLSALAQLWLTPPEVEFMVVVQPPPARLRLDPSQYADALYQVAQYKSVRAVGVPRVISDRPEYGGRFRLVSHPLVVRALQEFERVHLFGFSKNLLDDLLTFRFLDTVHPTVSIDTATPLWAFRQLDDLGINFDNLMELTGRLSRPEGFLDEATPWEGRAVAEGWVTYLEQLLGIRGY